MSTSIKKQVIGWQDSVETLNIVMQIDEVQKIDKDPVDDTWDLSDTLKQSQQRQC